MEEGNIGEEESITSEKEIFSLSGPVHLASVDWNNFHHRTSIAASLVEGVYILEHDRQRNRQGPQSLAPPWWEFFHFQLNHLLIDVDGSIFGAVYEFKYFAYHSAQNAPRFVVAFRGTIIKRGSILRDFELDLLCLCNELHRSSRFQLAGQALQNIVALAGPTNVWLAGHSLGSAIALLGGKKMATMGIPIESYLFNPPLLSSPIEIIKNQKLKHGIHFTSSMVKAGLAVALKGNHQRSQQEDPFVALSTWLPYLFVNPADPICSKYIGYFVQKNGMEGTGTGKFERLLAAGSKLLGAPGRDSEPSHLIPSACLTINLSESPSFKQAHGIHQWWNPNLKFQSELHKFS
ncbi:hypothetical protein P3X46_015493 [Hevea brasiliensis]|uniref:Fungal lipase-like domain-containing protein n=1 Tax=Hevea brasiliensis TaxID=3981 RepID=A0ABQ9LY04_HEVBR|nr:GDSL esterase/lipase At4g10955-like [Hevea brasiliensis]XP_058008873.1 GDSL esterase/lipase At4g10955-like [Hevea brasiliensis]XP_058008874.1 GDSL esterase/lipase At4g10955-like [Hevea brasiliensis]XP_058008875.1 GDSL esterase/lipase At4g10955-like [Hevea brasiliensis]KAJ9172228.1 hypothetical protein P3X46_015493 [Hevea brasiliensis]